MIKVAMPEADAWAATDENGKVEALGFNQSRTRFDTPLITTVKAEAYAAAKVREALEDAASAVHEALHPKNPRSDWTQFAHDRAIASEDARKAIFAIIAKAQ